MVGGRGFWILVWYGILVLGLIGLWASVLWGRRLKWQNLDEFLRAIGTVQVSIGMLMLLYGVAAQVATGLLGLAFGVFVAAFVAGRNISLSHRRHDDVEGEELEDRAERIESPAEPRGRSLSVGDRSS
jgi:hypothetical protein